MKHEFKKHKAKILGLKIVAGSEIKRGWSDEMIIIKTTDGLFVDFVDQAKRWGSAVGDEVSYMSDILRSDQIKARFATLDPSF